jgi:hypothetical protein
MEGYVQYIQYVYVFIYMADADSETSLLYNYSSAFRTQQSSTLA